tara:strand:- start:2147 stop:2734 length:588 start_codon:yes stop_codon:yes gene_type:complete
MSHKEPDGESCNTYFKYGKSFPDNVKDALEHIEYGATGPTGPAGPAGDGVYQPSAAENILVGYSTSDPATYVDASGWYQASNQYAPLVYSGEVINSTFTPDALNHNIFDITVSGTCTMAEPVNMKNGRTISIVLRQATDGNNTMSWNPIYHFDAGYGSLTYDEGAKDVFVGTKVNEFIFSTIANDLRPSESDTSL